MLSIFGLKACIWLAGFFLLEVSADSEVDLTHTIVLKPESKGIILDKLQIKKVNKTHHMLKGEFLTNFALGDDNQILCLAYRKAGNDYKLMPYKVGPMDFCKFLESEKMFYPEIKAVSDFPDIENCPWPPNTYHINGYHPDLSKVPPIADSGDYMIECQIKRGDEIINGMKVFGSVLNKPYG